MFQDYLQFHMYVGAGLVSRGREGGGMRGSSKCRGRGSRGEKNGVH